LRSLERLLLVVGVVFLGYWSYVSLETLVYQRWENAELDAVLRSLPAESTAVGTAESAESPTGAAPAPAARPRPADGTTIGRIEIPRLGISAIVKIGADAKTLRRAVGHIPGTALPGISGNVGLAAHRDTFFKRLRDIRVDDRIRVVTPEGTFTYLVAGMQVVNPADIWVLDASERPVLTLVTCFPFNYVGSAPQRFIVRAELL
jgi:sortase A